MIRLDGATMLLVEQSLNVALALAERAYSIERGAIRFEGRTANVLSAALSWCAPSSSGRDEEPG